MLRLQDSATAKSLAFNKDVRTRCVTLEGDDFNPSGTLTGVPPPLEPAPSHVTSLSSSCPLSCNLRLSP